MLWKQKERDKTPPLRLISKCEHEAFQKFCLRNVLSVTRFLPPVIVYIALLLLLNSHCIQLAFSQASTQPYLSENYIVAVAGSVRLVSFRAPESKYGQSPR
jgi:hypothetical protein